MLKWFLHPVLSEQRYTVLQAVAMAWDIRTGRWSEPELDLIPFAIREGDSVLDIGANYGLYSHHLARAVGRSGQVYAFEPVPFTQATFRRIAKMLQFRNVELIPKGCSERCERLVFRLPVQRSRAIAAGLAHIATRNDDHDGKEEQVRWEQTRNVWCEVVAVDECLPQLSELSFIKCDIEGAELFAFRGAEKTIKQHYPSVLCEINPWYLEGFGIRLEALTGFFFDLGYSLYRYESREGRRALRPMTIKDIVEDNYVFLHPSRRERFAPLLEATNGVLVHTGDERGMTT